MTTIRIRICSTCLFWSDLVAEQTGNGPLMALCENPGAPKEGRMVEGQDSCAAWEAAAIADMVLEGPRPEAEG